MIDDAGGWQHDTLTEDLDLSYRAQLRGWRFVYLPDLVAPAELPVEMNAFKTQQQRWAKGSVQVCKKLLPRILASPLPWYEKLEATFHLTANLAYPLMVLLAALMFPAMVLRYNMGWAEMMVVDVPIFLAATASVCIFYALSQKEQFPQTWKSEAQVHPGGARHRHRHQHQQRDRRDGGPVRQALRVHPHAEVPDRRRRATTGRPRSTRARRAGRPYVELALACYFTFVNLYALTYGLVGTLPFIAIFQWGFLYTSGHVAGAEPRLAGRRASRKPEPSARLTPWTPSGRRARIVVSRSNHASGASAMATDRQRTCRAPASAGCSGSPSA